MSIAQSVQNSIGSIPAGEIFEYQALPEYARAPNAVIKAVNRLVAEKQLTRFSRGKFYVPKEGVISPRRPSDAELIRTMVYKNGRLRGYITGLALYNQLGLTTQMPKTITLAYNGGRQEKDFGTIRIRTLVTRIPIREKDVKLLQYLDVLKDVKDIPDADVNQSLKIMQRKIAKLTESERKRLIRLAEKYYSPQTRALTGVLFSNLDLPTPDSLARSLNPLTIIRVNLDKDQWPTAGRWNVR